MATSSILTSVKITDLKKSNPLSRLLMLRQMIPKEPSAPVSRQMTNIDEIRRLMSKRVR